jgi:hypothetical protein
VNTKTNLAALLLLAVALAGAIGVPAADRADRYAPADKPAAINNPEPVPDIRADGDTPQHPKALAVYLSEGFNGATFPPAGWTQVCSTADDTWRRATATVYPSGYLPYEGAGMAEYNIFSWPSGTWGRLITPAFNPNGDTARVSFAFFQSVYTSYNDRLYLEYSTDAGATWANFGRPGGYSPYLVSGNAGWITIDTTLPTALSVATKIAFRGYSAYGYRNLYVDNVQVYKPAANDMSAVRFDSLPTLALSGSPVTIRGTARNAGLNTQYPGVPIGLHITGPSSYVYDDVDQATLDTLAFGASRMYTFSPSWTPPGVKGTYTLKFYTNLSGDQDRTNDTVTATLYVHSGWIEQFTGTDFPPEGWLRLNYYTTADDSWKRQTSYYNSSPACAYIYYDLPNNDWLITPRLGLVQADDTLRFYYRCHTYSSSYVESLLVRISTGGNQGDTAAYTTTFVFIPTSASFVMGNVPLAAFAGQRIYVAFHYKNYNDWGVAIDDIMGPPIYAVAHDVALSAFRVPGATAYPDTAYYPVVKVKNAGQNPESGIPVTLRIDSAGTNIYTSTTTWPGPLAAGDTALVTMPAQFFTHAPGVSYNVTAFTSLSGDLDPSNDTLRTVMRTGVKPNRLYRLAWKIFSTASQTSAGIYGITGVQDTLFWVSRGYLSPYRILVFNARTLLPVDSFPQYVPTGASSYGYRDMTYDPVEDIVYAGYDNNRLHRINATTHALIDSFTLTGSALPSVVRALTFDGESLYASNFGSSAYKFAKNGTNCHSVGSLSATSSYGLALARSSGLVYVSNAAGVAPEHVNQYDLAAWNRVHDTTLTRWSGTQGGCEMFRGDSFLLGIEQAPSCSIVCYRVKPLYDVSPTAIVAPGAGVDTGVPVTPQVRIVNRGDAQAVFTARLTIGAGYDQTLTCTLAIDQQRVYSFPSWTPSPRGPAAVRCSTAYSADAMPANDVLTGSTSVNVRDIGIDDIIRPNPSEAPGYVPVYVRVKNFGNVSATGARATVNISDGYSESRDLTALPAGETTTVTFTPWAAGGGSFQFKAKTVYSGDIYPANDSMLRTVVTSVAESGWTQKADIPPGGRNKGVKDGGCLAYNPETDSAAVNTGFVYLLKGNGTCEFYKYNTTANTWMAKESIPAIGLSGKKKPVKKGGAMTQAGGKMYAAKGNGTVEWWQYDPTLSGGSTYPWTQKTDIPAGVKPTVKEGTGAATVTIGDTAYVYFLRGSSGNEFLRYNTIAATWSAMAPAPTGTSGKPFKDGSALTASRDGKTLYALKGSYNEFFTYSVDSNTWTTRAPLPMTGSSGKKKKVKSGGAIAHHGGTTGGALDGVYAIKGNNTSEFWKFLSDSDRWVQKTDFPTYNNKRVKGGGAMVLAWSLELLDQGDALYATTGNNTSGFFRYPPTSAPVAGVSAKTGVQSASAIRNPRFALHVSPNPFTAATVIRYTLPVAGRAGLQLFDITGRLVAPLAGGFHSAGDYSLTIGHSALARGIYVLKLSSESSTATQKLIVQ